MNRYNFKANWTPNIFIEVYFKNKILNFNEVLLRPKNKKFFKVSMLLLFFWFNMKENLEKNLDRRKSSFIFNKESGDKEI